MTDTLTGSSTIPSAVQSKVVRVTPATAERILAEANTKNRTRSSYKSRQYAAAMARAEWQLNGETIIFDTNGDLMDGQHRLEAVVISGRPVDMLVVTGVSPAARPTLDRGKARTGADVLSLEGVKHPGVVAGAARWYSALKEGPVALKRSDALSQTQLLSLVAQVPRLVDWTQAVVAANIRSVTTKPDRFVALAVAFEESSSEKETQSFVQRLGNGADLHVQHPILLLRGALIAIREWNKIRSLSERAIPNWVAVALTIKAWNDTVDDVGVRSLDLAGDEYFPRIAGWDVKWPDAERQLGRTFRYTARSGITVRNERSVRGVRAGIDE